MHIITFLIIFSSLSKIYIFYHDSNYILIIRLFNPVYVYAKSIQFRTFR